MKNSKELSRNKIIILGILLNIFTILLFAIRPAFMERLFYSTTIFEKIFSLVLCTIWYIFLLKYKKENKKIKSFNCLNILILVFILLGISHFYIGYTKEEKGLIEEGVASIILILSFFGFLFARELVIGLLLGFIRIIIPGLIYSIFITTIFSKVSNKTEKEKKISIIYLPSIYCMVLSGIFILKTMPIIRIVIFVIIAIIIEVFKIKSKK